MCFRVDQQHFIFYIINQKVHRYYISQFKIDNVKVHSIIVSFIEEIGTYITSVYSMIDWQISWLLLNYGYVKKSYGIINVYFWKIIIYIYLFHLQIKTIPVTLTHSYFQSTFEIRVQPIWSSTPSNNHVMMWLYPWDLTIC